MKRRRRYRKKKQKYIIIFLVMMIITCVGLFSYKKVKVKEESVYFDGVNCIIQYNSFYATAGSNNDNKNNYKKAKITKYNKKREKTYEKLFNKGYNSSFLSIVNDEDNLIAVGSYEKTVNDYDNKNSRALIVKYNSQGEVEVERDLKLLDTTKFIKIIKVNDGYLVTGQSINSSGDGQALLIKYDKNLNIVWNKNYGNNKKSVFNDVVVIGNFIFTVGMVDKNTGIICKYDLNGNLLGNKTLINYTFNGIVNIDNNIFVCGSNGNDAVIVKLDLNCNFLQQMIYQSKDISVFNKIIIDKNNNFVVIGSNIKIGKNQLKNYDGIVGKYSSMLEEIAIVTYGDEREDYFTDINSLDDNYIIVGYSQYEDGSYLSKFINYSDALKVLEVE